MGDIVQLSLKCPKCRSSIILGYDPDVEQGIPCVGCGYTLDKEEVIEQAKPQLIKIAEEKALEAFKDVPGFKPNK